MWLWQCIEPSGQFKEESKLVIPNFFHLRIMEATVLLGTFNAAECFCRLPQICASTDLQAVPSTWLLYVLSAVRLYIERCVPFQIMSNQLNLPQVDSKCGNISKMIKRNGRHPPELNMKCHSKGSEYMSM